MVYSIGLFDIAEQCYASHDPVPGPDIGLEVDGSDVVELGTARLTVDRTLVQLTVLSYGTKCDRLVKHFMVQNATAW